MIYELDDGMLLLLPASPPVLPYRQYRQIGRPRVYASHAERQRAYRDRKKAREAVAVLEALGALK